MKDQLMEWLHEQQRKLSKSNLAAARIGIRAYQDVLDKIYELDAAAKWDKSVLTEGKDKGEMRHFDNTNAPPMPPAPPASLPTKEKK
jgi:nitroreductase